MKGRKPDQKIRVGLRVKAMRVAGKWFQDAVTPEVHENFPKEAFDLLNSFARRSGNYIQIERALAERFVIRWTDVLEQRRPDLLFQVRPCTGAPASGEEAVAEIVADIREALLRNGKGRPPKIDPLVAFDANSKHKRSRKRSTSGVAGDAYSHELVAKELGVNSKGTIDTAIRKGRETATHINKAKAMLPEGAEILFVYTDSHDGGKSGVLVASVPPLKKDVD